MPAKSLAALLERVHQEPNAGAALDEIVKTACLLTGSRNGHLAILDEEQGALAVRHAFGKDFTEQTPRETLEVAAEEGMGIVGFVAATGESVLSGDVHKEPLYRRLFQTTRSELAVPVRDRHGRIVAVLNLESDQFDAYTAAHDEIAAAMATLVAIILDRSESQSREEALVQIGSALDNSLTEEELIEQLIHVADDVLRFQAAGVFLLDSATQSYVLRGAIGNLKDKVGEVSYRGGEGCTGWVCETGKPLLLNKPANDPRWLGRYIEFPGEQVASYLCVPIVSRKRTIGAIRVLRRTSDNPYLDNRFNDSDLSLLEAIADQVASGLESIRAIERLVRSERMIAWGELSAKSSHMIGNRVFALKGDVNELRHLLEESKPDVVELKSLQRSLEVNLTRIEEILQDFRDFVSATQLSRAKTDLNALVRDTLNEVFPRRGEIKLAAIYDEEIPALELDAKKLARALSELIENSINWMQAGALTVSTDVVDRDAYAATKGSRTRRFARVVVQDSGPGVAEDRKSTIFQPFFSGRVKGMGLGLSIVKGIVDAHGGEVLEDGLEGSGARFVILLPVPDRP